MALERDRDRHEQTLVTLQGAIQSIRDLLIEVKTKVSSFESPGTGKLCGEHMRHLESFSRRMDLLEEDVRALQKTLWKWAGGLAVLVILLSLFGPQLRSALLHTNNQPAASAPAKP